MKKTLAALAVLSAFAGSAIAADVTLYGRVDLGLRYTNVDSDVQGEDDVSEFEMASGNYTGNRFGLKGTEELGNGMKVGFVLENGFDADDGTFDSNGDRMFGREAQVKIMGNFGELGLGRSSILASDAGSYGIGGGFNTFGTGWGDVGSQSLLWGAGFSTRYDNMLTYVTPEFAGFKVYAQYSFGDGSGDENKSTSNRYYGIGATYTNGGLNLLAVVDSVNKKSNPSLDISVGGTSDEYDIDGADVKDTVRAIVGGSYDFGFVKPYLSVAYFKDGKITDMGGVYDRSVTGTIDGVDGVVKADLGDVMSLIYFDGYAVSLGADAPLFGGKIHGMVGYVDADSDRNVGGNNRDVFDFSKIDFTRWMVGVGYDYNLSKRTVLYVDAGYMKDSWEFSNATSEYKDNDPSMFQFALGMAHYF